MLLWFGFTLVGSYTDIPIILTYLLPWPFNLAMMYIAATPVHVTVRYTGQHREDIAIGKTCLHTPLISYTPHAPHTHTAKGSVSDHNTVGTQIQGLFVRHFFVLFFVIFAIAIMEGHSMQSDPNYTIFKVIFEVISAYGKSK